MSAAPNETRLSEHRGCGARAQGPGGPFVIYVTVREPFLTEELIQQSASIAMSSVQSSANMPTKLVAVPFEHVECEWAPALSEQLCE